MLTPYSFRAENTLHIHGLLGVQWPSASRSFALIAGADEGILWRMPAGLLFPFGFWALFRSAGRDGSPLARERLFYLMLMGLVLLPALYFSCVPWNSNMASYGPRFFLAGIPFMTLLAWPRQRWLFRPFWMLAAYSVLVNHLSLIGLDLPNLILAFSGHQQIGDLTVHLFRRIWFFHPLPGLLLYLAIQSVLAGVILGLPWWQARTAGSEPNSLASPGRQLPPRTGHTR